MKSLAHSPVDDGLERLAYNESAAGGKSSGERLLLYIPGASACQRQSGHLQHVQLLQVHIFQAKAIQACQSVSAAISKATTRPSKPV